VPSQSLLRQVVSVRCRPYPKTGYIADSETFILMTFRQMTSHGGRVGPVLAELEFRARRLRRGGAVSVAPPTGRLGSLPSVP